MAIIHNRTCKISNQEQGTRECPVFVFDRLRFGNIVQTECAEISLLNICRSAEEEKELKLGVGSEKPK